jgi:glycosyltransferase involved in cell wall biosynthesis
MLSVVIPVYNVEKYLHRCLSSVVNQSYVNIEVLLINDGSTDGSSEVCRKFAEEDARIKYIEKQNEGSGPTRNLGISMARGEYITFLDSDDWWDINYVSLMLEAMNICDIAICDIMYVDVTEAGEIQHTISGIRMEAGRSYSVKDDTDLINKARTFLCGKVFKTRLFRDNNILQPSMAINDFPIVPLLVAKAETVSRVKGPMYYYLRGREGNTVTSFKALFSFVDALNCLYNNFYENNLVDKYEKALNKMYYSQFRFALRKGRLAVECGESIELYYKLKEELQAFIQFHWKGYPNIVEKTFAVLGKSALEEGIRRVIINDEMLKNDCKYADYIIVEKGDAHLLHVQEQGKIIEVVINWNLHDDDLFWDIADKILFLI